MILKKYFIFQVILIWVSCFFLYAYFPIAGDWDRELIRPYMTSEGGFYLKDNWYLATLGHQYVKWVLIFSLLLVFGRWIVALKQPSKTNEGWRYGYLFLMLLLPALIIGVLKAHSEHACPWAMIVPHTGYFLWKFDVQAGHCFPGGHSAAGFSLMAGYFVYRMSHGRLAYCYLISGLLLGMMMGWAQMMRGAHFLSHNLWTAWIVWTLNVLVYMWFYKKLS